MGDKNSISFIWINRLSCICVCLRYAEFSVIIKDYKYPIEFKHYVTTPSQGGQALM